MLHKKSRLDYKWVILIVCFLMEFLCLGFCSSNPGLYTVKVTSALNIDRTVYALSNSIRYIAQVFMALAFGTLTTRFGIKKMVLAGLCSLIGATFLRAFATVFWHFYIASAFHGVGMVFVGGSMAGTIVRRWFHKDIGKYTGIVMSANGIGGAVAAQIVTPIINNGEVFGYRKAYLLSATIAIAISIVIVIFLRDSSDAAPVVTKGQKKARGAAWTGIDYNLVKRKPYFYIAAALVFLTGISLQSIGGITIVYITDMGMPTAFIAAISTVSSLTLTFSKVLTGAMYDKKGLRFTLMMGLSCALVMFILKGILTNSTAGMIMAMTATVLSSIALPLETVMLTLLANDLFGSASFTKVLGVFMAMNSLGMCLGSPMGEFICKLVGDYRPCFWIFSVVLVVVIVAYIFVLKAANKYKNAVLEQEVL